MPYLIDRQRALRDAEIVVVLSVRQRGVRSRVVLRDNSLYQTLTRARTLRDVARRGPLVAGAGNGRRSKGVTWRKQQ